MFDLKTAFGARYFQHKDAQIEENEAGDVLQVIGAGLPRTGTSSLKAALEILGFDPCHHMMECFLKPERSILFAGLLRSQLDPRTTADTAPESTAALKKAMRGYRATVDAPGCDLYAELMTIYPDAKVILSVRDSDEQWWKSFNETIGMQLSTLYPILVYPIGFLWNQGLLLWAFVKRWKALPGTNGTLGPGVHAAQRKVVRETVPKERLLEFNVKEGWPPLCDFLQVPVPDEPFPNL
ncbi:MAG: hypothetical protein Q9208_008277 [Pyrenodesmia sp. 3 TL-2023]